MATSSERLAKSVMSGIKRGLRESHVPIRQLQIHVLLITDDNNIVGVDMNGVPPFTTSLVTINGDTRTYLGHAEVDPQVQPED